MTRRRFIQSLAGIPASACFGGFAIPAFAATVRKVALVVGNAGYAGTERLKNPVEVQPMRHQEAALDAGPPSD
ncbi:MAG: hypothetical protein C0470_16535 [Verminephrobacter sp.]|jgi:hypothetical protein|nr:hypothetical protein [Verminephrobacter sp.]